MRFCGALSCGWIAHDDGIENRAVLLHGCFAIADARIQRLAVIKYVIAQQFGHATHHVQDREVVARLVDGDVKISIRVGFLERISLFMAVEHARESAAQGVAIEVRRAQGREIGRRPFENAAEFEIIVEDVRVGPEQGDKRIANGDFRGIRHMHAAALHFEQAFLLERNQGVADGGARGFKFLRELPFGRQTIARTERALQDEFADLVGDIIRKAALFDRLESHGTVHPLHAFCARGFQGRQASEKIDNGKIYIQWTLFCERWIRPEPFDAAFPRLPMLLAKTAPPLPSPNAETRLLRHLLGRVIEAAQPAQLVAANLPPPPRGRTIVIGAGKASGAMARAFDEHWPGQLEGAVVIPRGSPRHQGRIQCLEASHPVPDAGSAFAAEAILNLVASAGPDDLIVALISGGGSSLLCKPAEGLTLADKQALNDALLASGASISEINTVRKHLSAIKGGRLVPPDCRARAVALLMSDVPGDDPSVIASGPTVPDSSTLDDARAVLERYRIAPSDAVRSALLNPANETPKPDDPRFAHVENRIILTPHSALAAALPIAGEAGYAVHYLGDDIEGDAEQVARDHARLAQELRAAGHRAAIISGGETSVRTRGTGGARGGRNSHYALALALALDGTPGIHAIAADTDGIDGKGGHAGTLVMPDSLARAAEIGIAGQLMLDETNSYAFFEPIGDLVVTGPTQTNVNDFRAILIDP